MQSEKFLKQTAAAEAACKPDMLSAARAGDCERLKELLKAHSQSKSEKRQCNGLSASQSPKHCEESSAHMFLHQTEPQCARQGANSSDWLGRTALSRAARYNRYEAIKILLRAGARVDIVDVYGQSAIHVAACHGHLESLSQLLMINGDTAEDNITGVDEMNTHRRSLSSACNRDLRHGMTPFEHLSSFFERTGSQYCLESCVTLSRANLPFQAEAILKCLRFCSSQAASENLPKPIKTYRLRPFCCRLSKRPHMNAAAECLHDKAVYDPEDHVVYQENGFHIFPHLLSSPMLELARKRVRKICASLHAGADPLRMYNLHQCNEIWIWELAYSLRHMVALHCGNSFYFYLSHLIVKPPHSDYAIPWHQDYRTKGESRLCSIWIALDDVDAENGGVRCLPGAHLECRPLKTQDIGSIDFTSTIKVEEVHNLKRKVYAATEARSGLRKETSAGESRIEESKDQYAKDREPQEFTMILKAGQASILHPLMPHYSPSNRSNRWRRGLLLRFAASADHVKFSLPIMSYQQKVYPSVFKDGSYFADYRSGDLFEGCSLKIEL